MVKTLNSCLQVIFRIQNRFPLTFNEGCLVWNTVLRRLEPDILGQVLSGVVVQLISYDQNDPQVTGMWTYLFVTKREELSKYYKSIAFFPLEKIRVLKDAQEEIKKVRIMRISNSNSKFLSSPT